MTNLIMAYDAMNQIQDAQEVIDGFHCGEGAIGELSYIREVIRRNAACIDKENDPDDLEFWKNPR